MNLGLPNATVVYYDNFVDEHLTNKIMKEIENIIVNEPIPRVETTEGALYKLRRKTMVFIDETIADNYILPTIWGKDVLVHRFTDELKQLICLLKGVSDYDFNICLTNYYSSGKNFIGWHSDNEEKGTIECIASFSFGAEREFCFRNKGEQEMLTSVSLKSGSLLIMDRGCQENYEHCLLQNKEEKGSRLNLTFRKFKYDTYL